MLRKRKQVRFSHVVPDNPGDYLWMRKELNWIVNTTSETQTLSSDEEIPELLARSWWCPRNFKSDDITLSNRNPWFSSCILNINSLSMISWYEHQALEYRVNWEIYKPHATAAERLLFINEKFSLLTVHHCQFRCLCQDMKRTVLYLWHNWFQDQWGL